MVYRKWVVKKKTICIEKSVNVVQEEKNKGRSEGRSEERNEERKEERNEEREGPRNIWSEIGDTVGVRRKITSINRTFTKQKNYAHVMHVPKV